MNLTHDQTEAEWIIHGNFAQLSQIFYAWARFSFPSEDNYQFERRLEDKLPDMIHKNELRISTTETEFIRAIKPKIEAKGST